MNNGMKELQSKLSVSLWQFCNFVMILFGGSAVLAEFFHTNSSFVTSAGFRRIIASTFCAFVHLSGQQRMQKKTEIRTFSKIK